jgi:hypothetical protein
MTRTVSSFRKTWLLALAALALTTTLLSQQTVWSPQHQELLAGDDPKFPTGG